MAVMAVMAKNVGVAKATIKAVAEKLPATCEELPYPDAIRFAVVTAVEKIPAVTRERLDLIIGHYL